MAQPNAIRAGRAYVELFADGTKLAAGLRAASAKLKAFGDGIRNMGMRLMGIGSAILAPLTGTAASYANVGDSLLHMSERTGMTVEELSALAFAANMTDIEMKGLELGVRRMQKFLVKAADGSDEAARTFEQLGLSAQQMLSLTPVEQLKAIAEKLAGIEDPAVRAAIAMTIFGRNGTVLLPLLKNGAAGIDAFMKRAQELGLVISTEDAKAAHEFEISLKELWATVRRGVFAIGSALAPVLKGCAEWIKKVVVNITEWIKANGEIIQRILITAGVVVGLGAALVVLGIAIKIVGVAIGGLMMIWKLFTTVVGLLGTALAAVMTPMGAIIVATAAVAAYLIYASGAMGEATQWLGRRFNELKEDAVAAYQGIADALAAGDIALAVQILWLTLKLEWRKGINWLLEAWYTFKTALIDVGIQAWYGLLRGLAGAWAMLEIGWAETCSFFGKAWARACADVKTIWSITQNWLSKKIIDVMGLLDKSLDTDAAKADLDQKMNDELVKQAQELDQTNSGIEAERRRRTQKAVEDEAGTKDELNKREKAAQEQRQKNFAGEITSLDEELQKAQKAWRDALKKAAEERRAKEAEKLPELKKPPKVDAALGAGMKKSVEVTGTFNAAAAYGMGYGPRLFERIAKAAEGTEKNTAETADNTEDAGNEFD